MAIRKVQMLRQDGVTVEIYEKPKFVDVELMDGSKVKGSVSPERFTEESLLKAKEKAEAVLADINAKLSEIETLKAERL